MIVDRGQGGCSMAKDLLPPILWPYSGCAGNAINGLQIFLLGAIVFATVATFAVRPYYRGHRGYGSSPLAVRLVSWRYES
jgi:hypothetical protein